MNTSPPNTTTVEDLLNSRINLCSPPEVFLHVSEILDDPTKSTTDAARVIENDPGLCARLLKIVNSAYFGFPTEIVTVSRAITMIGASQLRNLVLATVVLNRFSDFSSSLPSTRDLWSSSLRTALQCSKIAQLASGVAEPSQLFVCGLLHNIGGLLLFSTVPDAMLTAIEFAREHNLPTWQGEQHQLGFSRYEVGAGLAARWKLPRLIEETLRCHENPDSAENYPLECLIVSETDRLIQKSADDDNASADFSDNAMQRLQIDAGDLQQVSEQTEAEFSALYAQIFE